uniref:Uncharacterized protein n=1 Tax=Arundo donax TaxID=35708 RepID=A0A0A8Z3P4_ARUDO
MPYLGSLIHKCIADFEPLYPTYPNNVLSKD